MATPSRPARPVRPIRWTYGVGVRRHVEVDDVRDVLDVEAAGGDVGRDEDVERAVAEATHHPVAAFLGQPAVEGAGVVAAGAQRLGEVVDLAAGPGEDEGRGRVLDVEDPAQRRQLVVAPDDVGDLADARRRRPPVVRSAWTLIRAGSRRWRLAMRVIVGEIVAEKRAVWRSAGVAGEDRLEVLGEAHVEHLVGLVEDDDLRPRRGAGCRA